jgi:hypothetical protein
LNRYEKLAGEGGKDVVWFDITGRDAELRALGIDPRKALTELHIMDGDGRIRSEMDAYIVLMGRVPKLKLLAWFIGLPLIRPLSPPLPAPVAIGSHAPRLAIECASFITR